MSWGEWISLVGVLVAVCALCVTLHYAQSQRRRERIMLQPSLTPIVTTRLENQIGILSAGVANDGLGPARILSFQPKFDGEVVELREMVDSCVGKCQHRKIRLTKPAANSSVSPGRIMPFVEVACFAKNQDELDEFADLFEAATIDIMYQSFLGGGVHKVTVNSH